MDLNKYYEIVDKGIYNDKELAIKAGKILLSEIKGKELHDVMLEVSGADLIGVYPNDSDFKFIFKTEEREEDNNIKEIIIGLLVKRV